MVDRCDIRLEDSIVKLEPLSQKCELIEWKQRD